MIGIYKIVSPSNKIYIGQSLDIERRIVEYEKFNCSNQPKLYNSLKKYGYNNHSFEIIEECDINHLNERERYYQDLYDVLSKSGLNCILTNSNELPKVYSKETRLKMSRSRLGKLIKHESELKVKRRNKNPNKRPDREILDLETGIFYTTVTEAALIYNLNKITLMGYLRGHSPNRTNLTYV